MGTITVSDGTEIYFKDWGEGPVVTFSHGWPLSADQWDPQMLFLNQHGFRTIAHDRRGHGRSTQSSSGNNMDTYADDLAELIEALDLRDVTVVGHSTGGGEVTRYIGRHGTERVKQAVLISAVPPHLAPTADDPIGLPKEALEGIVGGLLANASRVLPGPRGAVLRREPSRRERPAGRARRVLARVDAVGLEELVRVRPVARRERLHRGPEAVRRADAADPRRRRPGRPGQQLGALGAASSRTPRTSTTPARRTA